MKPLYWSLIVSGVLAAGAPLVPADAAEAPILEVMLPTAQESPPAPAPAPPTDRDRELEELKRTIEALKQRVDELERKQIPEPVPTPEGEPDTAPRADPPRGTTTQLPNISVVGNLILGGGDTRRVPNRGRFNFTEFELAIQDAVAPNLRYDVYLAAAKEEEWGVGLEEGYLTATALAPGLSARIGRIRTPFGRFNPLHPHQWPFITQPSAQTALLGPEGLNSDGAVAEYLLPTGKDLFARLELGAWQTASETEDGLGFGAGENGAYSARLRLGREVGRDRELELGFSRYQGNGDVDGFGRRKRSLTGVDLTYRSYPSAYRRLVFSAELMNHQSRLPGDAKDSLGGFAYAAYRWNQFYEAGVRLDYTRFPYPVDSYDWGGSLFLTRYLTEQTSLRLEYQYTRSPLLGSGNGIYFQILFGSGPHTHSLQ